MGATRNNKSLFGQICSDEEKLIYILDGVHFQQNFIFGWTIPLSEKGWFNTDWLSHRGSNISYRLSKQNRHIWPLQK